MADYWPELRLTKEESQFISKYFDPTFGRRGVLRRVYPGTLDLNLSQRTPQFNFQIGRRCRVFGLSASGDVAQFQVQLITATGEKHTADFMDLPLLLGGFAESPSSAAYDNAARPLSTPASYQAYIMDPNIVLEPNQTLTINAQATQDYQVYSTNFHIDVCVHVWEFPGMPGSPL